MSFEKPRSGKEYVNKLPDGTYGDIVIKQTDYGIIVEVFGKVVFSYMENVYTSKTFSIDGPWFKDLNRMCDELDAEREMEEIKDREKLEKYKPYYKD